MSVIMKGITCCADCAYYSMKKHRCTRATDEGKPTDRFYADCPLPTVTKPQGWVSVKDRPPKSGEHVLATCEIRLLNGSKKRYVCEAYHAEEYSIPVDKYLGDTDCHDYNDEDDEYYLKEGWYEVIHNWDEYSSVVIEDFVTHWMPLPEEPKEEE